MCQLRWGGGRSFIYVNGHQLRCWQDLVCLWYWVNDIETSGRCAASFCQITSPSAHSLFLPQSYTQWASHGSRMKRQHHRTSARIHLDSNRRFPVQKTGRLHEEFSWDHRIGPWWQKTEHNNLGRQKWMQTCGLECNIKFVEHARRNVERAAREWISLAAHRQKRIIRWV